MADTDKLVKVGQLDTIVDEIVDKFGETNGRLRQQYETTSFTANEWKQGWWGASTGLYDANHNNAICLKNFLFNSIVELYCDTTYKMRLQAWDETGSIYYGIWNGQTFVTSNPNHFQTNFAMYEFFENFPGYKFKIVLFASDGTSGITTDDAAHVFFTTSRWVKQDVINETLLPVRDYTSLATWEIGSIYYSSGGAYDGNKWSLRTPEANKIYLPADVVLKTTNELIGTLCAFKYDEYGAFEGRIGESGSKTVEITAEGYYRFVLIKASTTPYIEEDTIALYSDGFSAMSTTLSELVGIRQYTYHATGRKIDLSAQGFNVSTMRYTLPSPSSIHEGLGARQDFDIYADVLFQLFSNNYVALINIDTGAVIASYPLSCEHGNSCQFSTEFYDPNDKYPLLYCFGYSNNLVYVNRVTDTGATLIRTYKLDTSGYRFSGGLDSKSNRLITIHYTNNSSTVPENNKSVITVWDLNNTTEDSNDNTLKPTLIKQTEIGFVPVVQGCTIFKGVLYVVSGYYPTYSYPVKITGFDEDGNVVNEITDFPQTILQSEGEGISFYKVGNRYKCYFATYSLYELVFE